MWEKMNREFAGAVVTRAQVRRNQELLSSRVKEGGITKEFESSCGSDRASKEGEELESLSTEVLEENQSTEKTKIDGDCDQTDQNSICENIEFNFHDTLFLGTRMGKNKQNQSREKARAPKTKRM